MVGDEILSSIEVRKVASAESRMIHSTKDDRKKGWQLMIVSRLVFSV